MRNISRIWSLAAVGGCMLAASSAQAITVTIDGVSSPTLLSDAVDTCMSSTDGPHVINITTDVLPDADRQVVITQPITINGDADNNSTPCDILVDMTGIRGGDDAGIPAYKSYIEIQTAGEVNINNVRIHPNADGALANFANSPVNNVSGIRVFKPALSSDTCTLNFTNVGVSGSASDNSYLSLGTADDLYDNGSKRWAGLGPNTANEVNYVKHGALHFSDDPIGEGSVVATLDHCEMGLSRGCAVSVTASNTTVEILGGIFGHSARDGIRVADGATVSIKGTAEDRVRVVRSANIPAQNSHSIEIQGVTSNIPLIEYVDVAGENTANGLSLRSGQVGAINFFRNLGKLGDAPNNHGVILSSADTVVGEITNSTIHGQGSPIGDPLGINAAVISPVVVRDTIFTSHYTTETIFVGSSTEGILTLDHCALTSDGLEGESMADPAITGNDAGLPFPDTVIINDAIYSSPQYLLTLEDYDWSDAQGADNPLNGAGNRNVLRPSNVAYLTAASGGGALTGGAGPQLSGIDVGTWMLMD